LGGVDMTVLAVPKPADQVIRGNQRMTARILAASRISYSIPIPWAMLAKWR
jgi:hypothetical protein